MLIKKVEPVYPEIAIISRISRQVILKASPDIYGRVEEIMVIRSDHPILEKPAIEAAKQLVYEPDLIARKQKSVYSSI